jgi:hypothetical protein
MSLKIKHVVTQDDLDCNPELIGIGAEVGDEIEVTTDSANLVGPRPKDRD